MKSQETPNDEVHKLYKTYWALILPDICLHLKLPITEENKRRLHDSHKKIYECESIAGRPYEYVSDFITTIVAWYATEMGIFIRTRKDMPEDIDKLPLSKCWKWL